MTQGEKVEVVASAIANARAGRRGAPPVSNVLEMLRLGAPSIYRDVMADAEAVVNALAASPKVEAP